MLASAGILQLFQRTGVTQSFELRSQSARIRGAPETPAKAKVVVIAISDATSREWEEPHALQHLRIAKILNKVRTCDPKWVGIDIIFRKEVDKFFVKANLPNPNADTKYRTALLGLRDRISLGQWVGVEDGANLNRFTFATDPANLAAAEVPLDADGVCRSVPFVFGTGESRIASLSNMLAARSQGRDPLSAETSQGRIGINFRRSRIQTIDALTLAGDGPLNEQTRKALTGATVLIGDTTTSSNDLWTLPTGDNVPGVFIHAYATASLMEGQDYSFASLPFDWLILPLFVLLLATLPTVIGFPIAGLAIAAWWKWASLQLPGSHLMYPVAVPAASVVSAAIGTYLVRYLDEARQRRIVERLFGANVSPEVRNLLLSDPTNLELGGRMVEASVLFVDLRSSVNRAYVRGPEAMMADLNLLYGAIVPAVHEQNGILVQFTGDGFTAIFGAPVALPDHAERAVAAGRQIMSRVERLNTPANDLPFRIGCGIHSGEVMYGNVGVQGRFEFTIIGDTVNVGARIESLTKSLGHPLLISHQTYSLLNQPSGIGQPIPAQIMGRETPITLYPIEINPGDQP